MADAQCAIHVETQVRCRIRWTGHSTKSAVTLPLRFASTAEITKLAANHVESGLLLSSQISPNQRC